MPPFTGCLIQVLTCIIYHFWLLSLCHFLVLVIEECFGNWKVLSKLSKIWFHWKLNVFPSCCWVVLSPFFVKRVTDLGIFFFSMSVSKIGSFFWFLLKGCFSQILTLLFCFFQIELPAVRSSFSSEGLKKPSGPLWLVALWTKSNSEWIVQCLILWILYFFTDYLESDRLRVLLSNILTYFTLTQEFYCSTIL